jgi:polar amino acid transport system substrate-binding protein
MNQTVREIVMHPIASFAFATAVALSGSALAKDWTTVRIGTEGAYPPFNYVDSNDELQGFDVEIARALCAEMAVECTYVAQDWDGIIPALLAGKYDAIVASMSITDERKEVIDFTDRYYTNSLNFVAATDSGITDVSPEGLAGKTLGAQSSTVSASFLEEDYADADIRLYPTQDEANLDLANGRLDALLADVAPLGAWLASDAGTCCAFVGEAVVNDDIIGIGIRKEDQDLKEKINTALAAILANGVYEEISNRYFSASIY